MSNGIFNTDIGYGKALLACLPVVGPFISEYQMLNPEETSRSIDSNGCLHRHKINGQIFTGYSTCALPNLHRHVTVCSAIAAIGSLTTAIAGVAAISTETLSPYYAVPVVVLLANSISLGKHAWAMYNDAYLFKYA
jgi:hypothetical protein